MTTEAWLPLVLGYFLPIGFFLLGWGGMKAEDGRRAATRGLLALALATLGYFAIGFAFHLGGAGFLSDTPGLLGLDELRGRQVGEGLYWGVIGLDGFFLTGDADTPAALTLFATYLPMVATAVLLPVLSLSNKARGWQTALLGLLTGALFFPLAACWTWGGGWLATLGQTLERGHGFTDYAGSGVVYLLGGMVSLGGLVALGRGADSGQSTEMPPAHFPLLANLGLLLAMVGWIGWSLGTPFHAAGAQINPGRVAANGLLAAAGATLTCLLYSWLALGHGDPLMVARGAAAGLIAVSAGAPFIPPWAALVVGALSGLILPLSVYLFDHLLRLADSTAAVATTALNGLWGLLALAIFADGHGGQGWNGIPDTYRSVPGQGVTGIIPATSFLGDPGQMISQVVGLAFIALLSFLSGWLVIKVSQIPLRLQRPLITSETAPEEPVA
jgi:Amt family ammonium transporter